MIRCILWDIQQHHLYRTFTDSFLTHRRAAVVVKSLYPLVSPNIDTYNKKKEYLLYYSPLASSHLTERTILSNMGWFTIFSYKYCDCWFPHQSESSTVAIKTWVFLSSGSRTLIKCDHCNPTGFLFEQQWKSPWCSHIFILDEIKLHPEWSWHIELRQQVFRHKYSKKTLRT